MKASGSTSPRVGCCQRTSASTPPGCSVSRFMIGWWSTVSSLRLIPRARLAGQARGAPRWRRAWSDRRRRTVVGRRPWRCTWRRPRCPAGSPADWIRPAAHGDADADPDHHVMAADHEGRRQVADQALGQRRRPRQCVVVVDEDPELVAAQPGGQVVLPQAGAQALGRPSPAGSSPAAWPMVSLTFLKSSRSSSRITGRARSSAWSAMRGRRLDELHAVRQIGQRVVVGLVAQRP